MIPEFSDPITPEELEAAMEYLRLNQKETAELVAVDRITVYRWQNGLRKLTGPPRKIIMEAVENHERKIRRRRMGLE